MKFAIFINGLGYGGTEKAACRWARGLKARGHEVTLLSLADGPRRAELEQAGVSLKILRADAAEIAGALRSISPHAIHVHAAGQAVSEDPLGDALALLPQKIPVVQTNVFGRLENPREDAWTDFRLFISWSNCVQAARRSFRRLDEQFFRRNSVAVYPLDPDDGPSAAAVADFRAAHGIGPDEIVFGHLARPDPIRWDHQPIAAFHRAVRQNRRVKFLLREPPPEIARSLKQGPDAGRFLILPATTDAAELRLTTAAMDVVFHYSKVGETFGYGVAEPMNLGKPAIVNSVPWQGQGQLELARHGECGFVANSAAAMTRAILALAGDAALRERMGAQGRRHVRVLADPESSLNRLEAILQAAIEKRDSPFAAADARRARETAAWLDAHQFGHSWLEQIRLRPFYYRVRFHELRKYLAGNWAKKR